MHYSPHQLAYFAHKLTLRAATDSMDGIAGALLDAQVDLNPHQIDAALFATRNPLSKGVILADEVGLGKTIEAAKSLTRSAALGRAQASHPRHCAGQSAQAVASGAGRQVRPVRHDP